VLCAIDWRGSRAGRRAARGSAGRSAVAGLARGVRLAAAGADVIDEPPGLRGGPGTIEPFEHEQARHRPGSSRKRRRLRRAAAQHREAEQRHRDQRGDDRRGEHPGRPAGRVVRSAADCAGA